MRKSQKKERKPIQGTKKRGPRPKYNAQVPEPLKPYQCSRNSTGANGAN